jgi:hypothetical protein
VLSNDYQLESTRTRLLGRWISADPLAIHALGADINPYAYVHGRVTTATDPLGLAEDPKHPGGKTGSGGVGEPPTKEDAAKIASCPEGRGTCTDMTGPKAPAQPPPPPPAPSTGVPVSTSRFAEASQARQAADGNPGGPSGAIPVVFPGFVPGGQPGAFTSSGRTSNGQDGLPLGHAGVVLIDDTSEATYYEYGPYDDAGKGVVNAISYGRVNLNEPASVNGLLQRLSEGAGHRGGVLGNVVRTTASQLRRMQSYARHQLHDQAQRERGPYDALTNNCGTFVRELVDAGIGTGPMSYPEITGPFAPLPYGDFVYFSARGFARIGYFTW